MAQAPSPLTRKKISFNKRTIRKTWFGPLCESISGQKKKMAPCHYEIVNTSAVYLTRRRRNTYYDLALTADTFRVYKSRVQILFTPPLCSMNF